MNKFFLLLCYFFSFSFICFSQKLLNFKGHCGYYYKTINDLLQQKEKEIHFYNFIKAQTVGSIGAQCSAWEAAFAAVTDSLHFYLEDIDSAYFNKQQVEFAWNYYRNLLNKPLTSNYKIVLGNEKKTNLPDRIFDKILIINSFHEFTFQKEMLKDISFKLKDDGILYIDESLARHRGQLHGICKKRMYLDEELIAVLKQNNYQYVNGVILAYHHSKPARKIFAFKKIH